MFLRKANLISTEFILLLNATEKEKIFKGSPQKINIDKFTNNMKRCLVDCSGGGEVMVKYGIVQKTVKTKKSCLYLSTMSKLCHDESTIYTNSINNETYISINDLLLFCMYIYECFNLKVNNVTSCFLVIEMCVF